MTHKGHRERENVDRHEWKLRHSHLKANSYINIGGAQPKDPRNPNAAIYKYISLCAKEVESNAEPPRRPTRWRAGLPSPLPSPLLQQKALFSLEVIAPLWVAPLVRVQVEIQTRALPRLWVQVQVQPQARVLQ